MSLVAADNRYADYRAPQETNRALIVPSLEQSLAALRSGEDQAWKRQLEFCGLNLAEVREQGRREAVQLAVEYTNEYASTQRFKPEDIANKPIVLSGHQPELFHAGVWFKNFVLSTLSQCADGIGINFLVDNDVCRSTAIRVPSRDGHGRLIAQSVSFDAPRDAVPWEMRGLESPEIWESFPRRVSETLVESMQRPLLDRLWPYATESLQRQPRIGNALAEGRHRLEAEIGLNTLEVPLSRLVSTRGFARFSVQLLTELPRLHSIYNEQLARYRRTHKIRSQAHPVPELQESAGWLEAPWWVYREESPKRQPLWVRLLDDQLILSDRAGWQEAIEGRLDCDQAASQWLDMLADDICLRPRALLTTMYLRLIVGDMFIHGIGGGKYDRLTDSIIREMFGVNSPAFTVATATLRLGDSMFNEGVAGNLHGQDPWHQLESVEQELRQLHQRDWRRKHHADDSIETLANAETRAAAQALKQRKRELLDRVPPRGQKWSWHHEMKSINRQLSELLATEVSDVEQQRAALQERLRQLRLLTSREYSFCLFPLNPLATTLKNLADVSA